MFLVFMPLFFIMTITGINEFLNNDFYICRMKYQGEFLYLIDMLLMIFICSLLIYELIPIIDKHLYDRRRR